MKITSESITYDGGCHCGAVRFRVVVDHFRVIDCNCSICRKKGFLHLMIPPENFTLIKGSDVLTTYTFNTHIAQHTFCSICGIYSFYRPRSHPHLIDVNVRCLDEYDLSSFEVSLFDGVNWEKTVHKLRTSDE